MSASYCEVMHKIHPKGRRVLAFAIDILFVIAIGTTLGFILKKWLIVYSQYAYHFGFIIAWVYHAVTNSFLCEGQSPGKVFVGLRVVTKNGSRVGLLKSLLRSFPIVLCFFGEPDKTAFLYQQIFTYILTPLWISLAYFIIFYPSCRATHDFLCGTSIIDATEKNFRITSQVISFRDIFILSAIVVCLLGWRVASTSGLMNNKDLINNLKKAQLEIAQLNDVKEASIQLEGDKFVIGIITEKFPSQSMRLAQEASCIVIDCFSIESSNQEIQTILMRGFDMKIYHFWDVLDKTFSASKWASECTFINK